MTQQTKPFIVANVREIIDGWEHFDPEGYSFSKMVEMLNEVADKHFGKNVTEPKEKPEAKKGFATYTPGDEKYYKQC